MFSRHLRMIIALHALGPTAEDVAESLDNGGWRGIPGNAGECPIARYLAHVLPDTTGAAVSNGAAMVFTTDGRTTETVMPIGPAAFITRFDDGEFAYLIDHSEPE